MIIATPNNVHRNQAVAAAKAGAHVIVEKPLAVTNKEAWDIVNACDRYGVKLMVGCDRRFWTQNQWAKQLVDQGVIGDVLMARASLHEQWHLYQDHVAPHGVPTGCIGVRWRGAIRHGRTRHRSAYLARRQPCEACCRRRQAHGRPGVVHRHG